MARRISPELTARIEQMSRDGLSLRQIRRELNGVISHGGVQRVVDRAGTNRPASVSATPLDVQARIVHDVTVVGDSHRVAAARNGVGQSTVTKYVMIARDGCVLESSRLRLAVAATRPRSTVIVRRADEPTVIATRPRSTVPARRADEQDDGPRHGTERGYLAHIHEDTEPCAPCRRAARDATAVTYRARQQADNAREDSKRRSLARYAAKRAGRSAPAPPRPTGDYNARHYPPARPTIDTDRN